MPETSKSNTATGSDAEGLCITVGTASSPEETPTKAGRKRQQPFGKQGSESKRDRKTPASSAERRVSPRHSSPYQPITPDLTPTKTSGYSASASRLRDSTASPRDPNAHLDSPARSRLERISQHGNSADDPVELSDDEPKVDQPQAPETPTPQRRKRKSTQPVITERQDQSAEPSNPGLPPTPKASPSVVVGKTRASPRVPRPLTGSRTVSDPTPVRRNADMHPREIDKDIERLIRTKNMPSSDQNAKGVVYVTPVRITDGRNTHYAVKIGFTKEKVPSKRLKRIPSTCKGVVLLDTSRSDVMGRIRDYLRVEKLAHAELGNFVQKFTCTCGTKHREYFTVDAGVAELIVRRWIQFCDARPWADDGELKREWEDRLQRRQHCRHDEAKSEHKTRGQRWESFVGMKFWDLVKFEGTEFGLLLSQKCLWELWSVVQGLIIMCLLWKYLAGLGWFFPGVGIVGVFRKCSEYRSPVGEALTAVVYAQLAPKPPPFLEPLDEAEEEEEEPESPDTVRTTLTGTFPEEESNEEVEGGQGQDVPGHVSSRSEGRDNASPAESRRGTFAVYDTEEEDDITE